VQPADQPSSKPRSRPFGSALLVVSVLALATTVGARAMSQDRQPEPEQAQTDQPGVRDDVAGHVPDQAEQVARAPVTASRSPASREWWSPGDARTVPEWLEYPNEYGRLGILNTAAPFETEGHPFFEPIGENGRACVSCHQPSDGMSLSVETIQDRWEVTGGKDPIFAPIDGMNCPNLTPGDPASHSLLLQRGLFRVFLPWPPKAADGTPIDPEFTIEVVRDPGGCNLDPQYGLTSDNPMISIYRRPRVAANLKYVVQQRFGVSPFVGKTGEPAMRDPDTGRPLNMNMMADARLPTLRAQAVEAGITHLQMVSKLTDAQLARIEAFERQIFAAQVTRTGAGSLVEEGGAKAFGPRNLMMGDEGVLGNNTTRWVFPMEDVWKAPAAGNSPEQIAARESIRRGQEVFHFRTFWIKDSMHLNTVGLGNPTKRTCATCHGMHMTGMDSANGWMDIGTTNLPWARETPRNPWNDEQELMPLFKITCKASVPPHPYLGRVIYTQDPGRALISGKCNDVGTIVMQQFRGLAARAPHFSNGSAENLSEVINFYDRRYNIGYTSRERADLVNFLSSL
jgi:hypothetical protein